MSQLVLLLRCGHWTTWKGDLAAARAVDVVRCPHCTDEIQAVTDRAEVIP